MPRVTSYALRSASPAKTRADAVVVGVVAGPKGPRLCDAAADVDAGVRPPAAPVPLHDGRDRQGRRGGQGRRRATRSTPRCWCSSASARTRPTPSPYAVPRASPPAASPTPRRSPSPCRARPPSWSPRWSRATASAATPSPPTSRTKSETTEPNDVVVLTAIARQADAVAALERAEVLADAVALCPRLGQHAAARLHAPAAGRARDRRAQGGHQGPRCAEGRSSRSSTTSSSPRWAAAASSASATPRPRRPAWSS